MSKKVDRTLYWLVFVTDEMCEKDCKGIYTSRGRAVTALRKLYEGELNDEYSDLEGCKYVLKSPGHIRAWSGNFIHPDRKWVGWIEKRGVNVDWSGLPYYPRKEKLKIQELNEKDYISRGGLCFDKEGNPIPVKEWGKNEKSL